MDKYVVYGGSTVKSCSTEYINGCVVWGSSSSYSYSSYNYNSSCPSDMTNLLGSSCHYMYNDSSGNSIYCNGEMTKSAKAGDTATTDGCSSGGGNYSSYSYSSYNYTPPSGQREQIWNSYGLKSWVRTDADSAKIETLKQACANVTYGSGDIWMSGAGDYNSVNFGMPDEAKCRSWTPGSSSSYSYSSYPTNSSSYSSYSYSSYNYPQCDWSTQYLKNLTQTCMPKTDCYNTANADYNSSECQGVRGSYSSSYSYSSYSSYPSYSSCTNEMISLLGSGCHFMYNDSSNTAVYCNSEMTKSAKLGDAAATTGCQSGGGYSSYGSYSLLSFKRL